MSGPVVVSRTACRAPGAPNVHPADAELKDRPLPRGQGPWLDYPTALAADWLIATGVIEGACRTG